MKVKRRVTQEELDAAAQGKPLRFTDCDLTGLKFPKNLMDSELYNCDLMGVDLSGRCLSGARFTGSTLDRANISGCICSEVIFNGSSLIDVDATNIQSPDPSSFDGANMERVDLSFASLRKCSFRGSNLKDAKLIMTEFGNVNNYGEIYAFESIFDGANMEGVVCGGTNFKGCSFKSLIHGDFEQHVILDRAYLNRVDVSYAVFEGASLRDLEKIDNCVAHGATFDRVDLSENSSSGKLVFGVEGFNVQFKNMSPDYAISSLPENWRINAENTVKALLAIREASMRNLKMQQAPEHPYARGNYTQGGDRRGHGGY